MEQPWAWCPRGKGGGHGTAVALVPCAKGGGACSAETPLTCVFPQLQLTASQLQGDGVTVKVFL